MDRADLLSLIDELENGTLAVRPNGEIIGTAEGNEWRPEELEAAVGKLTAELARLVKWAKLAPDYTPPAGSDESGELVDSEGIPL